MIEAVSVIIVDLPAGFERWRPDPFPGSGEAKAMGCACPTSQPWPGALAFASNCRVHELVKSKPN